MNARYLCCCCALQICNRMLKERCEAIRNGRTGDLSEPRLTTSHFQPSKCIVHSDDVAEPLTDTSSTLARSISLSTPDHQQSVKQASEAHQPKSSDDDVFVDAPEKDQDLNLDQSASEFGVLDAPQQAGLTALGSFDSRSRSLGAQSTMRHHDVMRALRAARSSSISAKVIDITLPTLSATSHFHRRPPAENGDHIAAPVAAR